MVKGFGVLAMHEAGRWRQSYAACMRRCRLVPAERPGTRCGGNDKAQLTYGHPLHLQQRAHARMHGIESVVPSPRGTGKPLLLIVLPQPTVVVIIVAVVEEVIVVIDVVVALLLSAPRWRLGTCPGSRRRPGPHCMRAASEWRTWRRGLAAADVPRVLRVPLCIAAGASRIDLLSLSPSLVDTRPIPRTWACAAGRLAAGQSQYSMPRRHEAHAAAGFGAHSRSANGQA